MSNNNEDVIASVVESQSTNGQLNTEVGQDEGTIHRRILQKIGSLKLSTSNQRRIYSMLKINSLNNTRKLGNFWNHVQTWYKTLWVK